MASWDQTPLESLYTLLLNSFARTSRLRFIDVAGALITFYAFFESLRVIRMRMKTTDLRGPSSLSFLWGVEKLLITSPDSGAVIEKWADEYGGVFEVPSGFGRRKIMLYDPKAIAHVFGGEPWTYTISLFVKTVSEKLLGKGILTATRESHRRQRKILAPAFSSAAIRDLTHIFYHSSFKAKGAWDSLIESNGGSSIVIEAQNWMNRICLDTIGIAGFAHDFGTLDGNTTAVMEILGTFDHHGGTAVNTFIIMLAQTFPWLLTLPSPLSKLFTRLNDTMSEISNAFLDKLKKEKEADCVETGEKSILGILGTAENQTTRLRLTHDEVVTQSKALLLAGYGTTSIVLTWALIELSKNPDIQSKLRTELLDCGADPTFDQLSNDHPYLDAVLHETLRIHPPLPDFVRVATTDDEIPLNNPILTRSGKVVDHISVAKGAHLFISVQSINRSTSFWGPDAKLFKPERWLSEEGIPMGAREIQGHRHLLTFLDGPRTCLGKGFALAELKVVLSILVKHFVFELRDGPGMEIETVTGIFPRPRLAGEKGPVVPMRVRRFE